MEIDVTQNITGMDGEPLHIRLTPEISNAFNIMLQLSATISEKHTEELEEKVLDSFKHKTLKDVLMNTLMVPEKDASMEDKKKDYKFLLDISLSDKPDFDRDSREYIAKRIWETVGNTLIAGRCDELLKIGVEKVEDEPEKPKKKKSK